MEELKNKYPYRTKEIDFLTNIYQKDVKNCSQKNFNFFLKYHQWLYECFFITGQSGTGKTSNHIIN